MIYFCYSYFRPGPSMANQVDSNQFACALIPNQRNDESNRKSPHQKNVESHHGNVESHRRYIESHQLMRFDVSHQTSQTSHQVFALDALFKIIESKCSF